MTLFNANARINLDALKGNLPALKAILKKTLKLDVGDRNAYDIQAVALGYDDYQTAKGLADKPHYSLKCNLGTADVPFYTEIPLGYLAHDVDAEIAAHKAVADCQAFLDWYIFKDEVDTGIKIHSYPKPEIGLEYQITLRGDTLGDIELVLDEAKNRLDNWIGFDSNKTGEFFFERAGKEVEYVECPACHEERGVLTTSHSGRQSNGCDADVDVYQCRECHEQWSE